MIDKGQHAKAAIVGFFNAMIYASGALDFLKTEGEKLVLAFFVALISGFGYQLGAYVWRRFSKTETGDNT